MDSGKEICKELKAIRRGIALENGIALDIPECSYKGECDGTCPRCDAEVAYLEHELRLRNKLGKAAMIAGVAFTLAAGQSSMAQTPEIRPTITSEKAIVNTFKIEGQILDKKNQEPLIAANIIVKKDGVIIGGARTNYDGYYTINNINRGDYKVEISYIGFTTKKIAIRIDKNTVINESLEKDHRSAVMMGLISINKIPVIEVGIPETGQRFDSDQIKHFPIP